MHSHVLLLGTKSALVAIYFFSMHFFFPPLQGKEQNLVLFFFPVDLFGIFILASLKKKRDQNRNSTT